MLDWKLTLICYLTRLQSCAGSSDMDQGRTTNLTMAPRVHFVAFVAYYVPFVLPAIHVAVNNARKQTSDINYTYSAFSNPDDPSCDLFTDTVARYLAEFFHGFARDTDEYMIVLATGTQNSKIFSHSYIMSLVIRALAHTVKQLNSYSKKS